jgi:hypothetical protein
LVFLFIVGVEPKERVNPFAFNLFSIDSESMTANQQSSAAPELSWLVIVPLLLTMFAVALFVRHQKTAILHKK